MKKNGTPEVGGLGSDNEKKVVVPSEKAINFLRSFARSYYVDKSLPTGLNSFCVN